MLRPSPNHGTQWLPNGDDDDEDDDDDGHVIKIEHGTTKMCTYNTNEVKDMLEIKNKKTMVIKKT